MSIELATNSSATIVMRDNSQISITSMGGRASYAVTPTSGAVQSRTLGPGVETAVIGPFDEGATLVITNLSAALSYRYIGGNIPTMSADGTSLVSGDMEFAVASVLHQSGVPIGIAPTGSVGANGAVTLGTALTLTYSGGLYLYYPTGALYTSSAAGFYWTVMSSTTAGTAYNNVYSPGTNLPAIPTTLTAIVDAGPGAFTGSTTEIAAIYVTVAGGEMGANGCIEVCIQGAHNNTAGNKIYNVLIGGTQVWSQAMTTSASFAAPLVSTYNRGVASRQVTTNTSVSGSSSGNPGVASIDTTADFTFEVRLRHGSAATDWIILEYCKIILIPRS